MYSWETMKNMRIKAKLILLFIAVEGAKSLNNYFSQSTESLFTESKTIITNTANTAISDSIAALDKKSQTSMELLSYEVANNVASFLYERDSDILLLSKLNINQKTLQDFYESKFIFILNITITIKLPFGKIQKQIKRFKENKQQPF